MVQRWGGGKGIEEMMREFKRASRLKQGANRSFYKRTDRLEMKERSRWRFE